MKRFAVLGAILGAGLLSASAALGATRDASIGNFWYEDDATGDRTKLVVKRGDQIVFTVREGVYPPHTVDVDELNVHSPGLLLGETYTTPALNKVGNFKLYCRPHEARGHVTRLIIQPGVQATTAAPAPGATPVPSATPAAIGTTPVPTATPAPSATLAPVGVGRAPPGPARRTVAVDPDSLEGLTGRARSTEPWTRALWFLLVATVPIVGAAGFAVRRELVRATPSASRTGTSPSSSDRRRSPARSPRSRTQKASGSARTSRGRRR